MSGLTWCILLGVCFLAKSIIFLLPNAPSLIEKFPRNRVAGIVLSTLSWLWVGYELYTHPIDFLAPFQPFLPFVCAACIPLSWFLLDDLLACRGWAGIAMLLPMPIILVCREYASAWRLLPISLCYVLLTLGMVAMFYPWRMRLTCVWLSKKPQVIRGFAILFFVLSVLLFIAGTQLTDFYIVSV